MLALLYAVAISLSAFAVPTAAQSGSPTGTPPFASYSGGPDIINNGDLNVHYRIPIRQRAGRGINFSYSLNYDSLVWQPVYSNGTTSWVPAPNWGWSSGLDAGANQYVLYNMTYTSGICGNPGNPIAYSEWTFNNFIFYDSLGNPNYFFNTAATYVEVSKPNGSGCPTPVGSSNPHGSTAISQTGGYTLSLGSVGAGYIVGASSITDPHGNNFTVPFLTSPPGTTGTVTKTDSNGNVISGSSGTYTDTLGTTVLTVTTGNPTTLSYTAPSTGTATYTVSYSPYTVRTNFGCSNVTEFGPTSESLVNTITLPDSSYYEFSYEKTPGYSGDVTGRLASVRLPSGGTIYYYYTGGSAGIECGDGTTAGLQRYTPDTGSNYWSYSRTLGTGGGPNTTTITDPQGNQTLMDFQGPWGMYPTEKLVYQGSSSSGTLLKTVYTCYNGATVPCNSTSTAPPFSARSVTVQWPGTNGLESETVTSYNTYGLVTEKDEYAYAAGAPGSVVRKTLTSYASLGNGILDRPSSVTVCSGSGSASACNNVGTVEAQTTYCYDEGTPSGTTSCAAVGSPTATSGTPQHNPVTGSRGNMTTVAQLVSGSTTLGKTYTYYDTGNPFVATDVNSAQTTFAYGTGSCGNSFATTITEPVGSMTKQIAWNCTGGVETSITDENGKITSTDYTTDVSYWRPDSATDPLGNTLYYYYQPNSAYATPEIETHMTFSNNTGTTYVSDFRYFDEMGRVFDHQACEDSTCTNLDTVTTTYDSNGRTYSSSLPCATTYEGLCSTLQGTVTYDALGRMSQITDSESRPRTVTFSYTQNDTYRTLGPAPTGENTKRRQYEYDALGRLTSVCEVTSLTGNGTCAQTNSVTGYWTQYTYDLLNDLTGVTQNAQSSATQTRTYTYDDVGRLTSEINPETGATATTYTYDTDSTCGTSKGDLVKEVDQVGNVLCYAYDALHRMTSVTYPSGSYASVTPSRYLVYDSATVNSVAMTNVKSRLAEAYTCFSPCSSKLTDIGVSYTSRGEISDTYESTPNSGAYNHVNQTYWPNGAPEALSAQHGSSSIAGFPTITYNVDGKGRIYSASASSGQNPLSSTSYNPADEATTVNFGSSDSDTFTYGPNTDVMTQYRFSVNGQSVVGALTWNFIGTLGKLVITDPFNSANAQTCTYSHDDLVRITSDNCGSGWSQTFSYDAFGNISKSGTVSFLPTYSSSTNRMTLIGSSVPTYDANGNVTNDFANTYSWDSNSRPVTIDGVGITYDALGRMAEQNNSGTYSQIVYGPVGMKLAILQGATLQKAFIPLTGGSSAVYNASGLAYYRHSDWLGSSRLASTPSRTVYFDGAYAPFGEPYAQSGTSDLSFTGMNQDIASNVYDFAAREYGVQGRWPSPDPAGIGSASPADPQTWNRYAYTRNNPLQLIDPTGDQPAPPPSTCPPWAPASAAAGACSGGGSPWGMPGSGCSIDGAPATCEQVDELVFTESVASINGVPTIDVNGTLYQKTEWQSACDNPQTTGFCVQENVWLSPVVLNSEIAPDGGPNPYVALGADALGLAAFASKKLAPVGWLSTVISLYSDPGNIPNWVMLPFAFAEADVAAPAAILMTVLDVGEIVAPKIDIYFGGQLQQSFPPQLIDIGNGQLISNPGLAQPCQWFGGGGAC
jgi:RHS repeat-associated protein